MPRPIHNVAWNLFLALIPVALAWCVLLIARRQRRESGRGNKLLLAPLLILWLAFLPNTSYLLTEWRHYIEILLGDPWIYYGARHSGALMADFLFVTGFFVLYTTFGVASFYLSIWPIDRLMRPPAIVKAIFFWFCSMGVYLGLIPRYNSWYLVHEPLKIVRTALETFSNLSLSIIIAAFAVVLWLLNFLFGLMMEGARMYWILAKNGSR